MFPSISTSTTNNMSNVIRDNDTMVTDRLLLQFRNATIVDDNARIPPTTKAKAIRRPSANSTGSSTSKFEEIPALRSIKRRSTLVSSRRNSFKNRNSFINDTNTNTSNINSSVCVIKNNKICKRSNSCDSILPTKCDSLQLLSNNITTKLRRRKVPVPYSPFGAGDDIETAMNRVRDRSSRSSKYAIIASHVADACSSDDTTDTTFDTTRWMEHRNNVERRKAGEIREKEPDYSNKFLMETLSLSKSIVDMYLETSSSSSTTAMTGSASGTESGSTRSSRNDDDGMMMKIRSSNESRTPSTHQRIASSSLLFHQRLEQAQNSFLSPYNDNNNNNKGITSNIAHKTTADEQPIESCRSSSLSSIELRRNSITSTSNSCSYKEESGRRRSAVESSTSSSISRRNKPTSDVSPQIPIRRNSLIMNDAAILLFGQNLENNKNKKNDDDSDDDDVSFSNKRSLD